MISWFNDTDQPMQPCRLISIIISMALKVISYYISFRFSPKFLVASDYNTRNNHKCEGRKEKSVPRIAVWHRARVLLNDDKR